jgi:hypothetical protein
MESPLLDYLAKLRVVIGYLGEREQFGWWQSLFFSASSQAFLVPVFASVLSTNILQKSD